MTRQPAIRAFTMIELILVVAITGILTLGLATVVEVPRAYVETTQNRGPALSDVQAGLSALERDTWFATAARVPSSRRLELDQRDGSTVVWEWNSVAGQPLTRTVGGQTMSIASQVQTVAFEVKNTNYAGLRSAGASLTTTPIQAASFGSFALRAGYTLGAATGGMIHVDDNVTTKDIADNKWAGIYLVPQMIADDDASVSAITVRLARAGAPDLDVKVYEADAGKNPVRSALVASSIVPNRAIPIAMGNVTIPLSGQKKLTRTKTYFVELRSAAAGKCAKIEAHTLSAGGAAAPAATVCFYADGGGTYSALTSILDASQTQFALAAVKSTVTVPSGPGPPALVTIQTAVTMTLQLPAGAGSGKLVATYPMLNAVAQVTQVR